MTADGFPGYSPSASPSALAGSYSNLGVLHSPLYNGPRDARFDLALGISNGGQLRGDTVTIGVDEQRLTLSFFERGQLVQQKTLEKDRDYRFVDGGVELARTLEGEGGEGNFYAKQKLRSLICLGHDGTLLIKMHDDAHVISLWPYSYSTDSWYAFSKTANP
jgi:hypothetical protein